mgnify:CR=1 FL=1|tara:strand:+ start:2295 stop:3668 length:1374 start_codon:yes stop_codon:yes gene_type:complete
MNRFIYFAAIVILCISFSACEKDDSVESSIISEVDSEFFRHSKAGGDEYKSFVLNVLSQVDDSIAFTGDFVATYGLPKWNVNIEIKRNDMFAMAVPVTDKEMTRINAIYYFALGEEQFEYYLFLNDREDVAYESMKRFIQVFETRLGLELSNTDFRVKLNENSVGENSNTKARRNESVSCFDEYVGTKDDPYKYYTGRHCTTGTPDMEWYSNRENTINTGKINVPNPLRGGGGIGNTEPEPDPSPKILPTQTFTNSKAGCIYDKLKNLSGGFAKAIQKFDGEFPVSHLKFSLVVPNNPNANASTTPPSNYIIEIKFNPNKLNRPNLSIARTMIHEMVHAEMFRKILSIIDNGGDLNGMTRSEWTNKLSNGDYPGIYDYYSRFGANKFQHEQMASHYRATMISIMKEFDNSQSDATYEALAWAGLHMTSAWNDLSPSKKTEIRNLWKSFDEKGGQSCD